MIFKPIEALCELLGLLEVLQEGHGSAHLSDGDLESSGLVAELALESV